MMSYSVIMSTFQRVFPLITATVATNPSLNAAGRPECSIHPEPVLVSLFLAILLSENASFQPGVCIIYQCCKKTILYNFGLTHIANSNHVHRVCEPHPCVRHTPADCMEAIWYGSNTLDSHMYISKVTVKLQVQTDTCEH